MPTDLAQFTPEVKTLARPQAGPLIGARTVVQQDAGVRATFEKAKKEGWTPEKLAGAIIPTLEELLDCEPEAAIEAAQYLADEFAQLGNAVLLCDRTTGKAIARISDEDMYQPPPQRREGSNKLVVPLPRLNPNLQGFLVSYIFEKAKDREMVAAIQARLPQTDFLRTVGDARLDALTRVGRLRVADRVRGALPDILEAVQGASRAFLDLLYPVDSATDTRALVLCPPLPRQQAEARGHQVILDSKAANLNFSWEATLRARIATGWVREIAAQVVNEARTCTAPEHRTTISHPNLTLAHLEGVPLWVGDPATCNAIRRTFPPNMGVPIILPCTTPFSGHAVGLSTLLPLGCILVHPDTYSFETRELNGRWETLAQMEYTLFLDWSRVRYLTVTGLPVEGVAEIF